MRIGAAGPQLSSTVRRPGEIHIPDFTRGETRTLRRLAEMAWDAELHEHLEILHQAFAEWQQGSISSFELSNRIHQFHDHDNRDLYNFYTDVHPSQAVAQALAHNYLEPSDVPDELLDKLTPSVTFFTQEAKRMP